MLKKMGEWIRKNRLDVLVLTVGLIIFCLCAYWANSGKEERDPSGQPAVYENAKVIEVLSDSTAPDENADGGYRGEQMLTAEVTTGEFKGQTMLVYNYVGPLYNVPVHVGDSVTLIISTYDDGSHTATVYEYNHSAILPILLALFVIAIIVVGGKSGIKSLIGLVFMAITLFTILLPGLLKGAPTILMTFLMCVFSALFTYTVMSGVNKKTVCAFLGTIAGMAMALAFAEIAQSLLRINGLRITDAEALLQLRQTGTPIGLKGLLSAGVVISSLGAVMDVAMGLASAVSELHEANSELTFRELFTSGMNIGKDMVGTMTSTLILALLGGELVLMIYLYSLGLGKYQLLSSAYVSVEAVSALSCSIGVILSIPITNFVSAKVFSAHK
ncbi:MAG: YibE/F family protein [Erysipelotrichaceae bacterium]|nr:YibE/F family protein [Erysipelotrichaceae bacterium]